MKWTIGMQSVSFSLVELTFLSSATLHLFLIKSICFEFLVDSNLNHLCTQLLNTEVRLIIDILKNLHSPSASELEKLTIHIDARLEEASSNLMYLNILLRFCKNLNIPEDVENFVTEALLLILFIWTESSFYSTK